jgi:hypothetical protein
MVVVHAKAFGGVSTFHGERAPAASALTALSKQHFSKLSRSDTVFG